ncbi:MAG: methyltransferase domain-containing protein [Pseudolabrys sp.]
MTGSVMQQAFRKDLSHSTWDEVYARQVQRAELVPAWIEALGLNTGDRVLDVGSGPGYVSLGLAERIGPGGMVYAVDRSRDALAHLERLQKERNIQQIRRMAADVGTLESSDLHPDSALISMVLHHADDPAGVLRNVHRLLPARARAVVAEFHPQGPCEQGAPPEFRLAPEQVQAWCEAAGFTVLEYRRQSPEHYMLVMQRAA